MPRNNTRTPLPLTKARGVIQPSTVAGDYAAITVSYRRLYTSVLPTHLHPPVIEHTRLGAHLLGETEGVSHTIVATALAEALLLAGRIEHAESVLAAGNEHASPYWFTWFSSVRLAAFKGNTERISAVRNPRPAAGRMSLSNRSPTYKISSALPGVTSSIRRKKPGCGLDTPQSSDVAIMSAGNPCSRRMPPARTVWFPAIPTHKPSARSWASAGRTSGYRSFSPNHSGLPASARCRRAFSRSNPGWNTWNVSR